MMGKLMKKSILNPSLRSTFIQITIGACHVFLQFHIFCLNQDLGGFM